MTSVRRHWPAFGALVFLLAITLPTLQISIAQNQGHLVYALDDPYIHMAMAKNIVRHGIWGVTPYTFSSSSSSPLWIVLLSASYYAFGVNDLAPLALNLVFACALVLLAYRVLVGFGQRGVAAFVTLVILIAATPVVPVIFTGMEHMLHACLSLAFLYLACEALAATGPERPRKPPPQTTGLILVAPLLTAARYEGLFLVLVVSLMLLIRKRYLETALIGAAAMVPIMIYGLYSVSHGWHFLPNPVLLKGNLPSLSRLGQAPHLVVLCVGGLLGLYLGAVHEWGRQKPASTMLVVVLGTMLLHLQFARTGSFFRYEAYLMVMGIVAIAIAVHAIGASLPPTPGRAGISRSLLHLVVLAGGAALLARGSMALLRTPQATTNIYEQQFQMARLLHRNYEGRAVAANDVGAINYFADIANLDLWGVASLEVLRARRGGYYSVHMIDSLSRAHGVRIAIVYDAWFEPIGGVPKAWIKAGEWSIRNNVAVDRDTISFYAVDSSETLDLTCRLQEFGPTLPPSVRQEGPFTDPHAPVTGCGGAAMSPVPAPH